MYQFILKHTRAFGFLAVALIATLSWSIHPAQLQFDAHIAQKLPNTIGYLFLVSMFVERAIEVFLSAWRSEEAEMKDLHISQIKAKISTHANDANSTTLTALQQDLLEAEKDRVIYSTKSRLLAQWMGLIIGICISFIGIRVLASIIDISTFDTLEKFQQNTFILVDIILTAAVLAGGSEAINKLMKVYTGFMLNTVNKSKE